MDSDRRDYLYDSKSGELTDDQKLVMERLNFFNERVLYHRSKGKYSVDMTSYKEAVARFGDKPRIHGHVPGIAPGDKFRSRGEVAIAGLHCQMMRGIDYMKASKYGAYAIVLSGGYADDEDFGERFLYTGEGGQAGGIQTRNQEMTKGNLGLKQACETRTPVRVIRGFVDERKRRAYAYEGLYYVKSFERTPSKHGPYVFRFTMEGVIGESVATTRVTHRILSNAPSLLLMRKIQLVRTGSGGPGAGSKPSRSKSTAASTPQGSRDSGSSSDEEEEEEEKERVGMGDVVKGGAGAKDARVLDGGASPSTARRTRLRNSNGTYTKGGAVGTRVSATAARRNEALARIRGRYGNQVNLSGAPMLLCEDLTHGKEAIPIPLVNEFDDEKPTPFQYVADYVFDPQVPRAVRLLLDAVDQQMHGFLGAAVDVNTVHSYSSAQSTTATTTMTDIVTATATATATATETSTTTATATATGGAVANGNSTNPIIAAGPSNVTEQRRLPPSSAPPPSPIVSECGIRFNAFIRAMDLKSKRDEVPDENQWQIQSLESYTRDGLLIQTDPCGVHECSAACRSPKCRNNKWASRGVRLPLEVFRTGDARGFGVRCSVPIPAGSFVACYIGSLITDAMADDRSGEDLYLFDLNSFMFLHEEIAVTRREKGIADAVLYKVPPMLSMEEMRAVLVQHVRRMSVRRMSERRSPSYTRITDTQAGGQEKGSGSGEGSGRESERVGKEGEGKGLGEESASGAVLNNNNKDDDHGGHNRNGSNQTPPRRVLRSSPSPSPSSPSLPSPSNGKSKRSGNGAMRQIKSEESGEERLMDQQISNQEGKAEGEKEESGRPGEEEVKLEKKEKAEADDRGKGEEEERYVRECLLEMQRPDPEAFAMYLGQRYRTAAVSSAAVPAAVPDGTLKDGALKDGTPVMPHGVDGTGSALLTSKGKRNDAVNRNEEISGSNGRDHGTGNNGTGAYGDDDDDDNNNQLHLEQPRTNRADVVSRGRTVSARVGTTPPITAYFKGQEQQPHAGHPANAATSPSKSMLSSAVLKRKRENSASGVAPKAASSSSAANPVLDNQDGSSGSKSRNDEGGLTDHGGSTVNRDEGSEGGDTRAPWCLSPAAAPPGPGDDAEAREGELEVGAEIPTPPLASMRAHPPLVTDDRKGDKPASGVATREDDLMTSSGSSIRGAGEIRLFGLCRIPSCPRCAPYRQQAESAAAEVKQVDDDSPSLAASGLDPGTGSGSGFSEALNFPRRHASCPLSSPSFSQQHQSSSQQQPPQQQPEFQLEQQQGECLQQLSGDGEGLSRACLVQYSPSEGQTRREGEGEGEEREEREEREGGGQKDKEGKGKEDEKEEGGEGEEREEESFVPSNGSAGIQLPCGGQEFMNLICVDAFKMGNVARFINHSCSGNLQLQPVFAKRCRSTLLHYVALYAHRNIEPYEELTYDYGYGNLGAAATVAAPSAVEDEAPPGQPRLLSCLCGAPECRKHLVL